MSLSSSDKVFACLCGGAIAGPFLFGYGFKLRKRYRLIENTPTSKTRSVAMGLVEVCGTAETLAGISLTSPFSCKACVYYRYVIKEERSSGRSRRWVTIASGSSLEPFLLKDDTGVIPVEPSGAELNLSVDHCYQTGVFSGDAGEILKLGMERLGLSWKSFIFDKKLRCNETVILSGDPVYVLGTAANRGGTAVIAKGEGSGYFCLSDGSEKDLLGSLKLKALLCLYGGPALTVFCLYLLLKFYWQS